MIWWGYGYRRSRVVEFIAQGVGRLALSKVWGPIGPCGTKLEMGVDLYGHKDRQLEWTIVMGGG